MDELGHTQVDLLKLDIEGAEYEVLHSVLKEGIAIKMICVEFDQPAPFRQMLHTLRLLRLSGYELVGLDGWDCTFVYRDTSRKGLAHNNAAVS